MSNRIAACIAAVFVFALCVATGAFLVELLSAVTR